MPLTSVDERPPSIRGPRARLDGFVARSARDLRCSRRSVVAILLLPAAACLVAVGTAGIGADAYKWLIREDGPVENLQFVLFLGSSVGALVLARHHARSGRRAIAGVFVLAAAGLLGIAGEEISWGQRIFGWGTPEALAEINRQGETTLHNVGTIEEIVRWTVFGIAVAAALAAWRFDRGPLHTRHPVVRALVPSRIFVPAFALIAGWRVFRETVVPPEALRFAISEFTEVVEFVMASTVAIFLWLQIRSVRHAGEEGATGGVTNAAPTDSDERPRGSVVAAEEGQSEPARQM
jgi:hypothetical protein